MASRRMLTQGDPGYAEMIAKLTAGAFVPQAMIDTYNTQAQNYNQQMADNDVYLASHPLVEPEAKKSLGQAISPDLLKNVAKKLSTYKTLNTAGGLFKDDVYQENVNPENDKYAIKDPFRISIDGNRADVLEYQIPIEGQSLKGQPLVATYDKSGNFQNITTKGYISLGGSTIAKPIINANGELIDQGIGDSSFNDGGGGLGSFISGFAQDFGPMLLAGLGANLFTGANLLGGEAAGLGGASAADIAANNALAGANLAGYAGTDLAATLPGAVGSSLADIGATTSPVTPPSSVTGTPLGSVGGHDISQLQSQLANTPMPPVTSGPPIAGEPVAGSLPTDVGNADKAALYGTEGYGAAASPAELASGLPSGLSSIKNLLPQSLQDLLPTTPAGMGALLSGAGNVASGLIGGNAAKTAAQTQADAATRAAQMQQEMFNTVNAQGAPYRAQGYNALNQIGSMLPGQYTQYDASGKPIGQATGSGYLTQQFGPEQFAAGMDPGYAFRLQQGQMANQRASNLAGGLIGGNALKGMQDYTQGMASQEYGNAFNRFQTQRSNIYNTLAGIAGIGQTAQGQANQMAQNNATAQGQLGVGSAAAQAAGQIGQANAYGGAATGAGNAYLLSQLLKQNQGVAQG